MLIENNSAGEDGVRERGGETRRGWVREGEREGRKRGGRIPL